MVVKPNKIMNKPCSKLYNSKIEIPERIQSKTIRRLQGTPNISKEEESPNLSSIATK